MGLFETVLLRKAKKLESEGLAKIKFILASVSGLDGLLLNAYAIRCPKPVDYYNRRDLVRIFNLIAKEIYGNTLSSPIVEGYGSFVMDMFSSESDLDLSINFSSHSTEVPRQKKIETLRKFAKKLYSIQRKGHVTGVQTIMTARVPIVKVIDCGTGIECDLSVDNRDGIAKSHIIHSISATDDRFQKLSFLMKSWAKANNINSSKDRTLNSLSIVSLVTFHLQTCNPPILPPFSVLLKEGADPTSVTKITNNYFNCGKKNKESLAELFITLFVKLDSVEKLWQEGLCASLYEGSWISKSWDSQSYAISIEDFTDRSQNVARAVGYEEVEDIFRCIRESLHSILAFLDGHMQASELMDILFGRHIGSTSGFGGTGGIDENINNLPNPILQNPHPPKKMRLMEGLEENQVQKPSDRNYVVQGWQGVQPWKGSVEAQRTEVMWGGMQQTLGEALHHVLASFNPSVPHQPSLAIPGSVNKLHHGYGQGSVPSAFPQSPLGSVGSYPIQSHLGSQQSSMGYAGSYHLTAVTPKPYLGSIQAHLPQVSHNLSTGDQTVHLHKTDTRYRTDREPEQKISFLLWDGFSPSLTDVKQQCMVIELCTSIPFLKAEIGESCFDVEDRGLESRQLVVSIAAGGERDRDC